MTGRRWGCSDHRVVMSGVIVIGLCWRYMHLPSRVPSVSGVPPPPPPPAWRCPGRRTGVFVSMGPSTCANGPIASSGTTACFSAVISHSNLEIHEHSRETARPPPPRLLYQPRTACRLIYCPASAYSVSTSTTFRRPCLSPSLLCQVILRAETLKPLHVR